MSDSQLTIETTITAVAALVDDANIETAPLSAPIMDTSKPLITPPTSVAAIAALPPPPQLSHAATLPARLQRSQTTPVNGATAAGQRTTLPTTAADLLEEQLPASMLQGTSMLLYKSSKKKLSRYTVQVDISQLRIIARSAKNAKEKYVNVESVKECRSHTVLPTGIQLPTQSSDPLPHHDDLVARTFSVVYLERSRCEALVLVPLNDQDQLDWLTGLRALTARYCHQQPTAAEEQNVWLRRQWQLADRDGDERVSLDEFTRICQQMNMALSKKEIKAKFKEVAGSKEAFLGYDAFIGLVRSLDVRNDLVDLFYTYAKQPTSTDVTHNLTAMSSDQFRSFLVHVQHALPTAALDQLVAKYTDGEGSVSYESFARFITSAEDNAATSPQHNDVSQDMDQPLNHYFINSSHNTQVADKYLIGNQLTGKSSVDAYIFALEQGCRCVELDCWDGPDGEPIVYHGYTLTSKILFKDIIEAVRKHAFERSPYPLILSLEVHCKPAQQDRLAVILQETLGDMLVSDFLNPDALSLPSPRALMHRILVKTKGMGGPDAALSANVAPDEPSEQTIERPLSTEDRALETEPDTAKDGEKKPPVHKHKIASALARIAVYCQAKHFVSYEHSEANDAYYQMSSFSEATAVALAKKMPAAAIRHNQHYLSRIYPDGKRVKSSNYNPVPHWAVGSQLVAINVQTYDTSSQLNRAMFRQNGRCGYVLKPRHLRSLDVSANPRAGRFARRPSSLHVKIISGQQLPRPEGDDRGDVIDPYCSVTLITPAGSEQKKHTKHVSDNGFNPEWNESFTFTVDDFDFSFLRVRVWDRNMATADDFVATYCIALSHLQLGYRHVPLYNDRGDLLLRSTLFIHTSWSR